MAAKQATAAMVREMIRQAQTLAYLDVIFLLGAFAALMIPLLALARRNTSSAGPVH